MYTYKKFIIGSNQNSQLFFRQEKCEKLLRLKKTALPSKFRDLKIIIHEVGDQLVQNQGEQTLIYTMQGVASQIQSGFIVDTINKSLNHKSLYEYEKHSMLNFLLKILNTTQPTTQSQIYLFQKALSLCIAKLQFFIVSVCVIFPEKFIKSFPKAFFLL